MSECEVIKSIRMMVKDFETRMGEKPAFLVVSTNISIHLIADHAESLTENPNNKDIGYYFEGIPCLISASHDMVLAGIRRKDIYRVDGMIAFEEETGNLVRSH